MKTNQGLLKYVLIPIILVFTLNVLSGCTPAKKIPVRNTAISADEQNGLNTKLSAAVNGIKGVKKSTVIVIGTSAYTGLELQAGIDKARYEALRAEADSVIKRTEPRIRTAFTSAHPATVRKINRVRAAVKAGKPASSYASEVRGIINDSELVK